MKLKGTRPVNVPGLLVHAVVLAAVGHHQPALRPAHLDGAGGVEGEYPGRQDVGGAPHQVGQQHSGEICSNNN